MNYLNYLNHILYSSDIYHRRFENDIQDKEGEGESQIKRVALASLPFLSLYPPAGSLLSVGCGAFRVIDHVQKALIAEDAKDWEAFSCEMRQTAIAVISVCTSCFSFQMGMFFISAVNVYEGALQFAKGKEKEEGLQLLASILYLSFLLTGNLELMLVFISLQTAISALQAKGEFAKGHYIEAGAKCLLGLIRAKQAKGVLSQIQRRNQCLKMARYQKLIERVAKAREVRHLLRHQLADLDETIDEREVLLEDGSGKSISFGSHFHGLGKQVVKGMNLQLKTRIEGEEEVFELQFKVNHVFREKLKDVMKELSRYSSKEMKEILALTGSHIRQIHLESNGDDGNWYDFGRTMQIELEGLGRISLWDNPDSVGLYDWVTLEMQGDHSLYQMHEMLAFLDLEDVLMPSSQEDLQRLKMGQLFRLFYPRLASPLERSEEFFSLSLSQLKQKMIGQAPGMAKIFSQFLDTFEGREVLPGRVRYALPALSDLAYQAGARGLTAAVTGPSLTEEELFPRLLSMLKIGMISHEMKSDHEIQAQGLNTSLQFVIGGADSVFTQMITEKNCKENLSFDQLYYNSPARLLISLNALELGSYQYLHDEGGNRIYEGTLWETEYPDRLNLLEFVRALEQEHISYLHEYEDNEVMLKDRINPSYFVRIVLGTEEVKARFLDYLREQDFLEKDELGHEYILGKRAEEFIKVASAIDEDLF